MEPSSSQHNDEEIYQHDVNWVCPICYFSNPIPAKQVSAIKRGLSKAELPVCHSCGVKASREIIDQLQEDTKASSNSQPKPQEIDYLTLDGSQCTKCTFINHPSMLHCEMCGAPLASLNLPTQLLDPSAFHNHGNPSSVSTSKPTLTLRTEEYSSNKQPNESIIKLSFRNGGSRLFYQKFQEAIEKAEWRYADENDGSNRGAIKLTPGMDANTMSSHDLKNQFEKVVQENNKNKVHVPQSVGIHGLQANYTRKNYETSMLLNNSLQDLEILMAKGKELIKLGRSYQLLLMNDSSNKNSASQQIDENVSLLHNSKASIKILDNIITKNEFSKSYANSSKLTSLANLKKGKSTANGTSTTTKSGFSTLYIEELARQIFEFVVDENLLDKNNGLITLYELYSSYNKARGINLISPVELYDCVSYFDKLNLNLKVTRLDTEANNNKSGTDTSSTQNLYIVSKRKSSSYSTSQKLLAHIKKSYDSSSGPVKQGCSVLQFQNLKAFKMNYLILQTLLNNLLNQGDLVVDFKLEGAYYYPNMIRDFNWDLDASIDNNFENESGGGGKKSSKQAISSVINTAIDINTTSSMSTETGHVPILFGSDDNSSNFMANETMKDLAGLDFS
ncbi:unnamed protein product [Ambrosiozyma monospora]|uniref:Unnamed protein product n=1 Tax=Ambrosiozyma monospora TaxID=43982 RepID=A0ACB5T543_AMBMO|nr:unnamed protein product [Ambrosiozyma monospora]